MMNVAVKDKTGGGKMSFAGVCSVFCIFRACNRASFNNFYARYRCKLNTGVRNHLSKRNVEQVAHERGCNAAMAEKRHVALLFSKRGSYLVKLAATLKAVHF